jgi:hypothetical protein
MKKRVIDMRAQCPIPDIVNYRRRGLEIFHKSQIGVHREHRLSSTARHGRGLRRSSYAPSGHASPISGDKDHREIETDCGGELRDTGLEKEFDSGMGC